MTTTTDTEIRSRSTRPRHGYQMLRPRANPGGAGVRPVLHRPHDHAALDRRARLARRQAGAVRAVQAGSGERGVPLRAGDLRGPQGVQQDSGSIAMFRPGANAERFKARPRRMAMPELPEETFVHAVELLVAQDREWIPAGEGNSLYLRPFMFATEGGLGVNHPSSSTCSGHRLPGRRVLPRWRASRQGLAVGGLHPGRARRHRRGQVRRQLRRRVHRAAAGGRQGLRPGGLAGRGRAPLGRGDGRDEPVLRVRGGRGRPRS